ncbi:MAG: SDR family oxidoreductase [Candidatus Paceibacterota bacterium]
MKNKVVVITGSSRGLGRSMARLVAEQGARVVVSSRDKAELEKTALEIGATAIVADVTKEQDLINLAREAASLTGGIDIWINNAGVWHPRMPIEKADMVRAHQLMEVNLFGTMYGARAVLLYMKKAGKGTIVNIISTAALAGRPNSAVYASSKYAARGFTDSLREEVKDFGITVIGVYPGGMKTDLFNEERPPEYDLFLDPDETAEKIIANLASSEPVTELVIKRPGQD